MKKTQNEKKQKNSPLFLLFRNKLMLLIASFALLIALAVLGSAAWFTRVSQVSGMTMDVAKFDFSADYETSEFIVQARDYMTSDDKKKAGPGAGGLIPLRVSAGQSNMAVDYSISLDFSQMAEDFRKRLCFYYVVYNESNGQYDTHYLASGTDTLSARINPGDTVTEYLYWHWVYDLDPSFFFVPASDGTAAHWSTNASEFNALYPDKQTAVEAHDEWDTQVGLGHFDDVLTSGGIRFERSATPITVSAITNGNLDSLEDNPIYLTAVQNAMSFKLQFYGVQVTPEAGEPENPTAEYTQLHPELYRGGYTTIHAISF